MANLIGFPNPVNEKAARTVAAGVLTLSVVTLGLSATLGHGRLWIVAVLAAGFILRVLSGHSGVAQALLVVLVVAAGLESIFGYCIGCKVFAGLMRLGVIPAQTCIACSNIALRTG